ncbi:SoxR reducing system RseC family protein [Proteobacteria bacterium 005FR1]|nr:SoxR reducing system RseC family protein [Proteobacteria bacterium 005FR1]
MLTETGRVIAIDNDHLWVETLNTSACGSCTAKSGCGQNLLARWASKSAYLRVPLSHRDPMSFQIGDSITIGIPEDVVVTSSLLMYCLPIVLLLAGAALGQYSVGSEAASVLTGLVGLVLGGLVVKIYTAMAGRRRLEPVLMDRLAAGVPAEGPTQF